MSSDPSPLRAPPDWRIRTYRPGDEAAVVELFNRVFDRDISVEHWRWKLRGYSSPTDNVWLAVDEADRPVFHYAGIPCRAHFADGEEGRVMVAVDAMTDPAFRRRGIFTAIMHAAHDAWTQAGFPLVLGLPNEQWGSRTEALGWEPLFGLRWLIRPLRPEALIARRLGLAALASLRSVAGAWNLAWRRPVDPRLSIRPVEEAGAELDEAWEACRPPHTAALRRGADWVAWRFLASPQLRYRVLLAERGGRPLGYASYRLDGRSRCAFLPELVAPEGDPSVWNGLLQAVLSRVLEEGAHAVATLAVPGSPAYRRLRSRGFLWSWGEFLFHAVFLDRSSRFDPLRAAGAWCLTGSEFDVL